MNQPNYFGIIPAKVRYDKRLNPNAKLLFCEITALSNQKGFCYATNAYFAELYNCSPRSISAWFAQLQEYEYIRIEIIKENGTYRNIYPLMDATGVGTTVLTGTNQISNGGRNDSSNGYEPNFYTKEYKDNNNTSFNNTEEYVEQKQVLPPPVENNDDIVLNPPKRKKKTELIINWPYSFTDKVIFEMNQYLQMRKEIGHPVKSQVSFSRLCGDCEKILLDYGEAVLIHSIGEAIKNGWRSIHPKQINGNYKPPLQKITPNDQEIRDQYMSLRMQLLNLRLLRPEWDELTQAEQIVLMQQTLNHYKSQKV